MNAVGQRLRISDELFGTLWYEVASELIFRHFFKNANFGVKATDIRRYHNQYPLCPWKTLGRLLFLRMNVVVGVDVGFHIVSSSWSELDIYHCIRFFYSFYSTLSLGNINSFLL
jgi:hypothetical protein